jgi:UDP-N-acetylglucosamine/UDP-N-acetylgalactosamine diphosphorylase
MSSAGPPQPEPELLAAFRDAGQEHVFAFWSELDEARRAELARQAGTVDLALVTRLFREADAGRLANPEIAPFPVIGADDAGRGRARAAGQDALGRGVVGFVTVAGGQATRLGFGPPKGARAVGPVSGKSLFRWHAEKVQATSLRYGHAIPWAIMTSDANDRATEELFEAEGWFGLEGQVRFVRQQMLPAMDGTGRIVLQDAGRIAMSPNGHGGVIDALGRGGALDWFAERGVEYLSYFQVDNPLVNPADPVFLGFQVERESEMSAKVVRKGDPLEKAGVVVLLGGRPGVLEYTELPEELARSEDSDGHLRFGWANIAAHVFTRTFLERMQGWALPWHAARKSVPGIDQEGRAVHVPALKFETFIFDAIPEARNFLALETSREEEFAPLKNAEGENSPVTVRAAILARTRRWYSTLGLRAPEDPDLLEIGPLEAYDLETFAEYVGRVAGGGQE